MLLGTDCTYPEMQSKPRDAVNMGQDKKTGRILIDSCCSAHFTDLTILTFCEAIMMPLCLLVGV